VVEAARSIDTVAAALKGRTRANRKDDVGRRAAKNRQKQREEPGECAKNAKDAYFISRHRL
jgi:hypothetical protein